jgi:hypothetical protein
MKSARSSKQFGLMMSKLSPSVTGKAGGSSSVSAVEKEVAPAKKRSTFSKALRKKGRR